MLDTYPSCRNRPGRGRRRGGFYISPLKREAPAFRHGEDVTYPSVRPRRLRRHRGLRRLLSQTTLEARRLVAPLFVVPGRGVVRAIPSLPGQSHHSPDRLPALAGRLLEVGVGSVLLFGVAEAKDAEGSGAWAADGAVQQAAAALKAEHPDLVVMTDLCLCAYTDHGHCGPLRPGSADDIDNDGALTSMAKVALSHAAAGADVVAPSAMMDGQVAALRRALDGGGHTETAILSYAAKHASAFYGPFRDAAASAPRGGDRRGHQLDPANSREGLRELQLDLDEGADMLMVKPALPCLDLIARARPSVPVPLGAYQVSGEYAALVHAAAAGAFPFEAALDETLTALLRAGCDFVVTYGALECGRRWGGG